MLGPSGRSLATQLSTSIERAPQPYSTMKADGVQLDCGVAVFDDLQQAAVTPSYYATNKANLIEILTYCRARV
jgi:hypothetical protein